ncbi:MAG: hypothetical protein CV045_04300 [Cyanobacteria bacterium M5B4]|nr:MAG: hypothetical protein CV045_04300 [Cyanobacteria bacterium M5B4]
MMIANPQSLIREDLLQILPVGIAIKDAQNTIVWVNEYLCNLLNLHPWQILGKTPLDIIHQVAWKVIHEDGTPFLDSEIPCYVALATGKPVRQVVMGINQTWILLDAIPKIDDKGQVIGVVSCFVDITAQKQSERQKKFQIQRIQLLLDNCFNGVVFLQGNKVIEANTKFAQMLGYTMPELMQLTPKDWEPEIFDRIRYAGTDTRIYETIHYRKDGSTYNAEVSVSHLEIDGNYCYLVMVKDITYEKLVEEALSKEKEQFINIFRSVSDGVAYVDRDYVFRFANNVLLARFDRTEKDVIGYTLMEVQGEELFSQIKPKFDRCLKGETVRFCQWINYPRIGRRYMSVVFSPYPNNEKEVLGVVASSRDLTAEKLAEERLESQRMQDHLIASITNELLKNKDYYTVFEIILPIVRGYFNCDRVVVYEFKFNCQAEVISSALAPGVDSIPDVNQYLISNHLWEQNVPEKILDIELSSYGENYRQFLRDHNIKSKMVLGIWVEQKLWGAICIQHSSLRSFSDLEAEFLCRISTQMGISIYQGNLYKNFQIQLQRSNFLYRLANNVREKNDVQEIINYLSQELSSLYPEPLFTDIRQFIPSQQCWTSLGTKPGTEIIIPHQSNPISKRLLRGEIVEINDTNTLTDAINRKVALEFPGAWLLVPIVIEDCVWGAVNLINSKPTIWSEDTKQFLQTIANQIAVAINKSREVTDRIKAEAELKRLNEELETMVLSRTNALRESQMLLQLQYKQQQLITKITNRIRSSLDLKQILQTSVEEVRQLLKNDRVLIYSIQADGSGEVLAESVNPNIPSFMGMKFSPEVYPKDCYEAYLNGKIGVIKFLEEVEPMCLREFMMSLGVRATMVAGIILDRELWGLLILHECNDRAWQFSEIDLIQRISSSIAIAIKQSSLYQKMEEQLQEVTELNDKLNRKLKEEKLVNLILEQIRWSFNLNHVLCLVTAELRHFLQCDRVVILQIKDHRLVHSVSSPADSEITDIDCHDILEQFKHGGYIENPYRLVVPILSGDNTLWGLLSIFNLTSNRWGSEVVNLVKQIANQLGIAIEKASLHQQMEAELRQKNALLKEVHHRVKNNLQIMSSLLRMQARSFDQSISPIIEDAQSRIYAMALVHEQLYAGNNFSAIDLASYVNQLAKTIFDTYSDRSKEIELQINIPKIDIPLDKTIPFGLIFNELITNALKYAFPNGKGKFMIDVSKSEKTIELVIADNGIGLPPGFDINKINSLGMLLVSDLVEQLEGSLSYHNDNGAVFTIVVPL